MEQLEKIWTVTKDGLRSNMTELSFKAWIEDLIPVSIQNNVLVLEARSPEVRKTILDFFFSSIVHQAKTASPDILDVKLILPSEREKYLPSGKPDEEPAVPNTELMLNPKYTFNTFVIGSSNHFAHAASMRVAEDPAHSYNPLFLYGGVGLGKTHLMHAIGHFVKQNNPNMRVIYVTSETFTNELINAIQNDERTEFRKKYRNADVLLIDDVQFIAKKQAVQEEFFNTFNTLYNANKQIVISSDRPPKEISSLEERLSSRFAWGLIADIQPPDLETRIAILRNRAKMDCLDVSEDVINYIAENVNSNIRELEGCLTRAAAYSKLMRMPLNIDITKAALKDILPQPVEKEITADLIKETVSEYYGITVDNMMSQRRDREIALPRQIAMYLCHEMLDLPHMKIVSIFNRTDHTTSINAKNRVSSLLEKDPSFAATMEDIRKRIRE